MSHQTLHPVMSSRMGKEGRMDFLNRLNKKTRNDWAREVVSRRHWERTQLAQQQCKNYNDTAQRFHRIALKLRIFSHAWKNCNFFSRISASNSDLRSAHKIEQFFLLQVAAVNSPRDCQMCWFLLFSVQKIPLQNPDYTVELLSKVMTRTGPFSCMCIVYREFRLSASSSLCVLRLLKSPLMDFIRSVCLFVVENSVLRYYTVLARFACCWYFREYSLVHWKCSFFIDLVL